MKTRAPQRNSAELTLWLRGMIALLAISLIIGTCGAIGSAILSASVPVDRIGLLYCDTATRLYSRPGISAYSVWGVTKPLGISRYVLHRLDEEEKLTLLRFAGDDMGYDEDVHALDLRQEVLVWNSAHILEKSEQRAGLVEMFGWPRPLFWCITVPATVYSKEATIGGIVYDGDRRVIPYGIARSAPSVVLAWTGVAFIIMLIFRGICAHWRALRSKCICCGYPTKDLRYPRCPECGGSHEYAVVPTSSVST